MTFDELKEKYPHFVAAADYLEENCYFFKATFRKIKQLELDYEFAEKLCKDCYDYVKGNKDEYHKKVHTLIDFSVEFLRLQLHLHKTGHYLYSSYEELDRHVYSDPNRKLKGPWYMWALYFSQIFWVTHWNVFKFFISEFVKNNNERGDILEVPVGTGIFISYFLKNNSGWNGAGVDLGETAIEFAKNVLSWDRIEKDRIDIIKEDIYKFKTDKKFDKILCGEFLEHVEDPLGVLKKLHTLLNENGRVFLTVAVYAEMVDHIYLYRCANDVREHVRLAGFVPEKELVQAVFEKDSPEGVNVPINYCAILKKAENE
ncbi:MAG: class I SAM-dependent methyltransferase [Patescibacteria group bacterium]